MKMGKMSWMMMAGCGAMLLGVFLLPALGVKLGGVGSLLLVLLCPLSHVLMMGMMRKGHSHSEDGGAESPEHAAHHDLPHSSIALPAPRDKG